LRRQIDKQIRKVDKEISDLEQAISKQETLIAQMDGVLANPAGSAEAIDELWYKKYAFIKKELSTLMNNWENKQLEKETLEAETKAYQ